MDQKGNMQKKKNIHTHQGEPRKQHKMNRAAKKHTHGKSLHNKQKKNKKTKQKKTKKLPFERRCEKLLSESSSSFIVSLNKCKKKESKNGGKKKNTYRWKSKTDSSAHTK